MPLHIPSRPVVALWALGFLTSAVIAVATTQGIGVSPDGASYLRLATEFSTSGNLHTASSWVTTTHFPPGWSLAVGAVSWVTGTSVIGAARLFQVVVAGLLVVATGRAMAVPGHPIGWLAVAAAAWFGLLYSLFSTSTNALSEPLFLLLCVGAMLLLDRFQMDGARRHLVAACILIAAAILTRYVGVALVVPLVWVAARWPVVIRQRCVALVCAPLAAVAPVALWIVAAPTSDASAIHSASSGTADVNDAVRSVEQLAFALARPPGVLGEPVFVTLVSLLVLAILAGVVRALADRSVDLSQRAQRRRAVLPWAAFGASYVALVAAQRWWIDREVISRYWIPAVLAFGVTVIRTVSQLEPSSRRAIRVVTALLVLSTAWNVDRIVRRTELIREAGIGLNGVRYDDSEVVRALRDLGEVEVLTDNPAGVAYLAPGTIPRDLLLDRVHDRECRSFDEQAIARLVPPAAVALIASCDLAEIRHVVDDGAPGATVVSESRVGTVFIWSGVP